MPDWYVYMIRCDDGSVYTGISTDVARRLREHLGGGIRAARYLRSRRPIEVIFSQCVGNRSAALSAEYVIKRLDKPRKESLAAGTIRLRDVLAQRADTTACRNGRSAPVGD